MQHTISCPKKIVIDVKLKDVLLLKNKNDLFGKVIVEIFRILLPACKAGHRIDRTSGEKVFKNSTSEIRRYQSLPNKAKYCLQAFSAERCKSQLKSSS